MKRSIAGRVGRSAAACLLLAAVQGCIYPYGPLVPSRLWGGGIGDFEGAGWEAWIGPEGAHGWYADGDLLASDGTTLLGSGDVRAVASSPAPDAVLLLSYRDEVRAGGYYNDATSEVYLYRPSDGSFRRLTHDGVLEDCPALSPRGDLAAFVRSRYYPGNWLSYLVWHWGIDSLVLLDLDDGVETSWPLPEAFSVNGAAIDPEGSFVIVSAGNNLLAFLRDTEEVRDLGVQGRWPVISADGNRMAFSSRGAAGQPTQLCVARLVGASLQDVAVQAEDLRPLAFDERGLLCERVTSYPDHLQLVLLHLEDGRQEVLDAYPPPPPAGTHGHAP